VRRYSIFSQRQKPLFHGGTFRMPLPAPGLDAAAWIALDLVPSIGGEAIRALLTAFPSPREVFAQDKDKLSQIVGSKRATAIGIGADPARVEAMLEWLARDGNHLLTLADEDYPQWLLETPDPPAVLYMKGRREMLRQACVAVVGSRNATPGGRQIAEVFSKALSDGGLTIVSGLAMGIDAAAHQGGLAGASSTIAVVGTGLDLVYPARNKALAREISERGLIVSEFALGTPALAANFPRRNRIISGLARGVLVVEAALASGSLITARQAGEQGREVFAIPGSIHSPLSKGTHLLIKQGAKLVDDASDIFTELRWETALQAGLPAEGRDQHAFSQLMEVFGYDLITVDELSARTGMQPDLLISQLLELELNGQIAQLPGGRYQRLA